MRVRCVSNYLNEEQRAALGRRTGGSCIDSRATVGKEYLVLALDVESDPWDQSTGPHVLILLDNGHLALCDLDLFEVSDARISRHWQIYVREFDGSRIVQLFPPALRALLDRVEDDSLASVEQDVRYDEMQRSDMFRRRNCPGRTRVEQGSEAPRAESSQGSPEQLHPDW
jgi:hypothetical protein